jgi:hypothetical protein
VVSNHDYVQDKIKNNYVKVDVGKFIKLLA